MADLPKYVRQNVAYWTRANTEYTDKSAAEAWAKDEIEWGVFPAKESAREETRQAPEGSGVQDLGDPQT